MRHGLPKRASFLGAVWNMRELVAHCPSYARIQDIRRKSCAQATGLLAARNRCICGDLYASVPHSTTTTWFDCLFVCIV